MKLDEKTLQRMARAYPEDAATLAGALGALVKWPDEREKGRRQ